MLFLAESAGFGWDSVLYLVIGLVVGAVAAFFLSRYLFKRELKKFQKNYNNFNNLFIIVVIIIIYCIFNRCMK